MFVKFCSRKGEEDKEAMDGKTKGPGMASIVATRNTHRMRNGVGGRHLKRIVLGEWEEYVGWLTGFEESPEGPVAVFDHAAVVLSGDVDDLRRLIGKRVGILRTDDAERPMLVRVIPTPEGDRDETWPRRI